MEEYVSLEVHREFAKRIEEENHRQNKRLDLLEESVKETQKLSLSMEKMATSMELMVKEQEKQGKRLEVLEGRDGEMWRKVAGYIITAVVGVLVGFIFTQIGF